MNILSPPFPSQVVVVGLGKISQPSVLMELAFLGSSLRLLVLLLLLLLSRVSRVRLCATHRRQPARLPRPWGSPGKNTGVGCHFLLQCMKVKSESEVAQSCLTLSGPMDCSLPSSSVHPARYYFIPTS